jgi:hypothetical protein
MHTPQSHTGWRCPPRRGTSQAMDHVTAVRVDLDTKLATVEVEAATLIDAMNMLPTFVSTIKVGAPPAPVSHAAAHALCVQRGSAPRVCVAHNGCVRHCCCCSHTPAPQELGFEAEPHIEFEVPQQQA